MSGLSPRLLAVVDALPLRPGLRVLEIGGAPGAAAREVAARVGPTGHVLVLDRSATGIERTRAACAALIETGALSTLCAPVEDFGLDPATPLFDLAFACRVGALDGRHPALIAGQPSSSRSWVSAESSRAASSVVPLRYLSTTRGST